MPIVQLSLFDSFIFIIFNYFF